MQNEQQGFKDWPQRISLESRAHYLHYLIWSWTEKAPDGWKMQNWDEGTGDRRVKPNHLHSGSRQVIWKQVEDCTVNSQHEWVNYVTVAFSIQGQFSDIVFLWPQRVTMLPLLWQCSVWKQSLFVLALLRFGSAGEIKILLWDKMKTNLTKFPHFLLLLNFCCGRAGSQKSKEL